MAQVRKYAQLPDLDNAPDIYETPDLVDDASTLQTSTGARSPSPTNSEDSDTNIIRQRLQPDQARNQFLGSRVDAREADFSDRLGEKRRSLRREVEEVKAEFARRKTQGQEDGEETGEDEEDENEESVNELSKVLQQMRTSSMPAADAQTQLMRRLNKQPRDTDITDRSTSETAPSGTASATESSDTQTLSRVADFDTRLTALERALGISTLDPTSPDTTITPILPTLSHLDTQLQILSSPSSLEALAQRLQSLPTPGPDQPPSSNETAGSILTPEDTTKLHSLFSLLPTLTTLSPTLPLLLDRLRSLRSLHANAASASQALDEVEKRQGRWRPRSGHGGKDWKSLRRR
ncbi:hypothetical protein H2203_004759 [Taxawa tesnikishii (nom. ined.)]|nr:hypothetical protein H2203_004759 [Dothideales sp. JES 119]